MLELLAAICLVIGGFFAFVAGIGIVRLSDIFLRMHASTKAGTLGIALIALSMMLLADSVLAFLEPLFVFLFMILTIPIGAHLIGRAAYRTHIRMDPATRFDPECETFRSPIEDGRTIAPPSEPPAAAPPARRRARDA